MIRFVLVALLGGLMSGCIAGGFYYRASDGLRADANPKMFAEFQQKKAICTGKSAQSALGATYGGQAAADNIELVMRGCMAEQGYLVRPTP